MNFIRKNIHWIAVGGLVIAGYLLMQKIKADKKAKEAAFVGKTNQPNALGI